MKPHESPRIRKKSIRGDSGDSWPVWNRGIRQLQWKCKYRYMHTARVGLIIIFQMKTNLGHTQTFIQYCVRKPSHCEHAVKTTHMAYSRVTI